MQMEQQRLTDHIENKCPHILERLKKAEAKRAICNTKNPPIDQMIAINAGGQLFTASKATLTKYPLSVLGILFSDTRRVLNRHNGVVLLDINGRVFGYILTWLQYGVIASDLSSLDRQLLLHEAKQLELTKLEQCLQIPRKLSQFDLLSFLNNGSTRIVMHGMDLSGLSLKQLPLSSSVFIDCIFRWCPF